MTAEETISTNFYLTIFFFGFFMAFWYGLGSEVSAYDVYKKMAAPTNLT